MVLTAELLSLDRYREPLARTARASRGYGPRPRGRWPLCARPRTEVAVASVIAVNHVGPVVYFACARVPRATTTGQSAWAASATETDPSSTRPSGRRPGVPSTIIAAPSASESNASAGARRPADRHQRAHGPVDAYHQC